LSDKQSIRNSYKLVGNKAGTDSLTSGSGLHVEHHLCCHCQLFLDKLDHAIHQSHSGWSVLECNRQNFSCDQDCYNILIVVIRNNLINCFRSCN